MAILRVRNLTRVPITIKGVEAFEDLSTLQSKHNGYFFSPRRTHTAPQPDKPDEQASTPRYHELDVVLQPFEFYFLEPLGQNEELKPSVRRITIHEPLGTQHSIDVHPYYTQKSSHPFNTSSTTSYTALFHPIPTPHLTILPTRPPTYFSSWLSTLPSSLPLSSLSLPGTHNSHTHYRALPSVRCQVADIATQLAAGIRFLDIRLQVEGSNKGLVLVHGAFPVSLTGPKGFKPVLDVIYGFLREHEEEMLVMSLKREGIGSANDFDFARILEEYYIAPDRGKWYTGTAVPTLGEVRGKIILVRRFESERQEFGLDATGWPGSAGHAIFPSPPMWSVQDYHNVLAPSRIKEKVGYVKQHLTRAAKCRYLPTNDDETGLIHLNFLSASNFWNKACWPEKIAKIVNRATEEWLSAGHCLEEKSMVEGEVDVVVNGGSGAVRAKGEGDGGTGIVIMDFVGEGGDWDLVKLIIGMNIGVLSRFEKQFELDT